jgi:hypothetical protein
MKIQFQTMKKFNDISKHQTRKSFIDDFYESLFAINYEDPTD